MLALEFLVVYVVSSCKDKIRRYDCPTSNSSLLEYIQKSYPNDIADLRLEMLDSEPKYKLETKFESENGEFFRSKFRFGTKFFYPRL